MIGSDSSRERRAHDAAAHRTVRGRLEQRATARFLCASLGAAIFFVLAAPAAAENGLNLIGFGAESILMGGADVAVARDTSALNSNPAGLTQIRGKVFDFKPGVAKALDVSHADALGNDRKVSNDVLWLAGAGYAQPISPCRCTVGLGLFVQGGAGYEYKELQTPFGNRDEFTSLFGIARLAAGAAWQATDDLSLGVSVSALYSRLDQRLFPSTSFFNPVDPTASFAGLRLDKATGVRPGLRVGVQYRGIPDWTLGAVYAPRTALPLTDGTLTANFSSVGLGLVTFRDVRVEGFSQPEEAAVGAAWQVSPALLLSLKLQWLGWSKAVHATTLRASNPDNSLAPPSIVVPAAHNWRDQWVYAFGAAYRPFGRLTLYGGVNYGKNPIPAEHLSPILAAILEWHVTTGFKWDLARDWALTAGVEYQVGNSVTYSNPQSIFGRSTERAKGIVVPVMLSVRW